ncbi:MAG: hypothetical protein EAZ99_08360 [Alphaproteobacteria bacterium]|nr:hypothetical protein [Alphaproteobacteria bacterium]TAD89796.1 MAG: hypothetical protein EAZ99_08360 [Alphaproteobacteria bacterium]
MFTFLKNLLGVKADSIAQAGVEALVRWDPKAATEAELRTMEEHLDRVGKEVAQARIAFEREQKEADAIVALQNQRMAAAEHLNAQLAVATDPHKRQELEASLGRLIAMLEEMIPEVEREKQDAVDARSFLEMLESAYADAGTKLRAARGELERAQRDMQRASQQREMAERQSEAARRAAGLAQATNGLGTALKSMRESAEADRVAAEAAAAKARLLGASKPELEDANIKAALDAAAGRPAIGSSLTDRLAALQAASPRQLPRPS